MKVKIIVGQLLCEASLLKNNTAKAIFASLPIEGSAKRWGDEIYFDVKLQLPLEKDAKQDVEIGEIAYWPEGPAICIFFGKTPISKSEKPRAYSPVNVFGKINVDATILNALKKVKNGDKIRIEKA